MSFDFSVWSKRHLQYVEDSLQEWVGAGAPMGLAEAMRYSVLDGGKRLRALLTLAAAQAVGGHTGAALRAACAVELIHAYSLVHDDMPCMDNDSLRRGKPTVHVAFGEAMALLAGDALQAQAFELLTQSSSVPITMQAHLCRILARAAGAQGMAGGQAIDLQSVGKRLSETQLRQMHRLKTGALLEASVMLGAACAGETINQEQTEALKNYAQALGLAFQVVDDVLDVVSDAATLGKTPGKDAAQDKPTYVALLGLEGAKRLASDLHHQASSALAQLPPQLGTRTHALYALAAQVVQRRS